MPIAQVIVLAIVQGLTEFLPISSTAHLYLSSWLLGWKPEALDFDISLHIGTLLAVLIYFLPDWIQIIGQGFGVPIGHDEQLKHNHMMLWLLAMGSIPVGIAGLALNKQAEGPWRNPYVMGTMLVAIGVVMWFAERGGRDIRDLRSLNLPDSIVVGLSQMLAIVPLDVWITANFKETQLDLIRPGQKVNIKVDAYPQVAFRGHVDSIQRGAGQAFSVLPAENATGNFVKVVQRVPVKIVFDGPLDSRYALGPGMSVVPTVHVR